MNLIRITYDLYRMGKLETGGLIAFTTDEGRAWTLINAWNKKGALAGNTFVITELKATSDPELDTEVNFEESIWGEVRFWKEKGWEEKARARSEEQ